MLVKNIPLKDCLPMPEVSRQFYNRFDYLNLKRLIEKDGYDKAYPVRVIRNNEKKVYEVFDGIHRLQILNELGTYSTIPAIDETEFLTRSQAVAKGIKANQFRAPYNPMDLANSLYSLGKSISKDKSAFYKTGRPVKFSVNEIAKIMRMQVSKVDELLSLRRLPDDVQALVGDGKLRFSHAKELAKLVGTKLEKDIIGLAEKVVNEDLSFRKLKQIIEAIKHKGVFSDNESCSICKKVFPHESMNRASICPHCATQIRNGELESLVPKFNPNMAKYLKFRNFAEGYCKKRGIEMPVFAKQRLEKLHCEWMEEKRGDLASET
jgi:hypothetical protein